ncbi:ATP-binding cassette domain-containing protein [Halovenus sp. WSH3]|uniref:ATP-binding cassette domain-containing protein n=1 Tax=Halovenus carboxidivorans TaxID=2692199 RepID=A0A6B0TCE8_9EURY|nr:ABC transporter ATP-binding protein [Halovenus carboxidivorans]MXR50879.1 ATP-binding cassette domain-containing protein [Halovenus carboxidivorans]
METSGSAAITATGLTKRFGETVAVDGVDLDIPRETVYGFLGPNGAGKTTTIEMLTTLTPPTSGTARVAGVSIENRDQLKQHIGYLPHDPPVYESFTAREQLAYAADIRQVDPDRADERIDAMLERVDLLGDANDRIGTYSQGMRRKVGLVQALLHDPDVVFLDEPTSGLDPRSSRTVIELINEQVETGTTAFLSSHILPVVEELADTVGVLYRGRLVAEDSPERLVERTEEGTGTLEEAFLDITTEGGPA